MATSAANLLKLIKIDWLTFLRWRQCSILIFFESQSDQFEIESLALCSFRPTEKIFTRIPDLMPELLRVECYQRNKPKK